MKLANFCSGNHDWHICIFLTLGLQIIFSPLSIAIEPKVAPAEHASSNSRDRDSQATEQSDLDIRPEGPIGIEPRILTVGERCKTVTDGAGICVNIDDCPQMENESPDTLRKATCGFQDNGLPEICCPIKDQEVGRSQSGAMDTSTSSSNDNNSNTEEQQNNNNRKGKQSSNETLTFDYNARSNINATVSARRALDISAMKRKFPQECGVQANSALRIIGGEVSPRSQWPWFALLMIDRQRGTVIPECGATLISDRWIITAAHCIMEQRTGVPVSVDIIKVRLGEHDLKSKTNHTEVEIEQIVPHPDFQVKTFKNDIALLRLKNKVEFTKDVAPVCLPYDDEKLRNSKVDDQTAWVIGFGRLSFNGKSSNVLRQADLKIVKQATCAKAFSQFVRITREYVCAISVTAQRKDSCQGDSGGPLLMTQPGPACCRWYIFGIVSFGHRCATPGYPGVYTRVNQFLSWIESVV